MKEKCLEVVVFVLSGNFGNLIVGLIVKILGLLIKCFIVLINVNDIVLCYLKLGKWELNIIVVMFLNVMDVSCLNNWLCVEEFFKCNGWSLVDLGLDVLNDVEMEEVLKV